MISRSRIPVLGTTPHLHEQQAIEFVLNALPDADPVHVWALFDLVEPSGRRYEIDLVVLGYSALYHIEIKSHPGRVRGDVVDWTYTFPDGRSIVRESPLKLAELKSKVLGSMLDRVYPKRPFVETLVFLSDPDIKVDLEGAARARVITRPELARAVQYRAPEIVENPRRATAASDVFSLGALAFFLFAGRPPGATLKEREELFAGGGGKLSLASVDDAFAKGVTAPAAGDGDAVRDLDALVGMATDVSLVSRADNALEWMALVLDAVTSPPVPLPSSTPAPSIDPLEARPQDVLDGGLVVKGILGTGATARVLRVREGDRDFALKVSRDATFDDRLAAEAATLKRLRGERIVSCERELRIAGRTCLLLQDAGETLADLLAKEGPPSLDYAQRWGDDLLLALYELEDKIVRHREAVEQLLSVGETVLLTQPGILARYGLEGPLHALREASQRDVEPRAVFLLLPIFDEPGPTPRINAGALPPLPISLTSAAQRVRISAAWLAND
jgi:hypothetical protein